MVSANELRINSLFLEANSRRYMVINSIHEHYQFGRYIDATATFRVENYELTPIPLSKELVLKCGFKDNDGLIELDCFAFRIYYTEHGILLNITGKLNESVFCHHVKYLHQLQNLVHSLSNSELEINL